MATPAAAPVSAAPQAQLAGIGERFVALIIDAVIIVVPFVVVRIVVTLLLPTALAIAANILLVPVMWVAQIAYDSYFLASPKQATIGKQAMGIIVTDTNGLALNMQRAIIRSVAKFVSGLIILLGYVVAFFTPNKQTLHDLVGSTLVVKGKR